MIRLDTHAAVAVNVPQLDDRGDPAGHLIIVVIGADGSVAGTIRERLPDPPDPQVTVRIGARLMFLAQPPRTVPARCVVAVYGPADVAMPPVTLAAHTLAHMGVAVDDVVRVHDGRVWCLLECEPGCPADTAEGELLDPLGPAAVAAMTELHRAGGG